MALKVKLEDQDQDTALVDIPLFATAQDAIKDIHIDEQTGLTDKDVEKVRKILMREI